MIDKKIFEKLADIEHIRWSNWQKYVHSICIKNEDGSLTIPKEFVEGWKRQINTKYDNLTETEKISDRKEVKKYLKIIVDNINKHKDKSA